MRLLAARALAAVCLLAPVAIVADDTPAAHPVLSGEWSINKSLSTAAGMGGTPDGGRMHGRGGGPGGGGPGGGGGMGGGGGRRGGFGGGGGGGGMRGGGPGGPGGGDREEQMAARRALMQEVMQLPARFTLAQDGDKLTFIEPDGVVRTYVADGKPEKHSLTNGTIETKARWDKGTLLIELKPSDGMKITRTFALRTDAHQLEVTTTFDGGPKDAKRVTVYDPPEAPAPTPR